MASRYARDLAMIACESALHSPKIRLRFSDVAIHAQRVMAYLNRGVAVFSARLTVTSNRRVSCTRGAISQFPRWPGGPPTARHLDATPGSRRGRPSPRMETIQS